MSFTAALQALRDDATAWAESAAVLQRSSTVARDLTLTPAQMSFASEAACAATYEQVRARLERLLSQGAGETDAISVTLMEVRAAYLSSDQTRAQALKGSWDVK